MTQLMEPRPTDSHGTIRTSAVGSPTPGPARSQTSVPLWRRLVPALAIAVMVMAGIYATVPFSFAGAVECRQHGLSGATPAPGTPAGTIIGDMKKRCADTGNSRITIAALAGVLAATVGLAGAFAPTTAEAERRRSLAAKARDHASVGTRSGPVHVSS